MAADTIDLFLPDVAATARLAVGLAGHLQAGDVIALDGPLGAGKTTFVRALVVALGGDAAAVASPTFTLLHTYPGRLPVVHVDAYRLENAGGLLGLGFDELAAEGVGVVEWAERVADALPPARTWRLAFAHAGGDARRVVLTVPPGRAIPPALLPTATLAAAATPRDAATALMPAVAAVTVDGARGSDTPGPTPSAPGNASHGRAYVPQQPMESQPAPQPSGDPTLPSALRDDPAPTPAPPQAGVLAALPASLDADAAPEEPAAPAKRIAELPADSILNDGEAPAAAETNSAGTPARGPAPMPGLDGPAPSTTPALDLAAESVAVTGSRVVPMPGLDEPAPKPVPAPVPAPAAPPSPPPPPAPAADAKPPVPAPAGEPKPAAAPAPAAARPAPTWSDLVPGAGKIVRIPAVNNGDPLVRDYIDAHRATCAWTTIAWTWIVVGMVAAVVGTAVGSHFGGPVPPLTSPVPNQDVPGYLVTLNTLFGNLGAGLIGLGVAAVLASGCGVAIGRRGVPAGQEPLLGAAVIAGLYLLTRDPLICIGVVTSLLCVVYFLAIAFRLLAVALGGRHGWRTAMPAEPPGGWPLYTVLVPLYKERGVARNILVNLGKLDYPRDRLDVKFLLEADDPETLHALEAAGVPPWAEVVIVPQAQPKTKPRACNHGLMRARGDFLVIFDAEDRPDPDQLKQAIAAFAAAGDQVVCLQAQLAYHNHAQNLLTRWFAIEYNVWFRRYLGGLVRLRVPIPLGGTSNHFRTAELRDLGGWDPFNVTEDCDLGVRIYMHGHRTETLDSTTWEEANSRVGNWIRQRSRWLKGYFITHLVWSRRPLHLFRQLGPWGAAGFFMSVSLLATLAAFNLLLWSWTILYGTLIAHDLAYGHETLRDLITTRSLDHTRWSFPMLYSGDKESVIWSHLSQAFFASTCALVVGNLIFVLLAVFAGRRPGQKGLWWAALISPLYWVLIAFAAWKAVWQLVFKPHYWEKTVHGLDGDHANDA
jgi:tRNA threonylcarbamoyl adenosine modification protein YjeE